MNGHIAALILIAGTGAPDPSAIGPSDRDDAGGVARRFAGRWKLHQIESPGLAKHSATEDDGIRCSLKIAGNSLEFGLATLASGREERGTFTVVATRDGFSEVDTDVVVRSGSDLGKDPTIRITSKEIWRLVDADTLQICFADGDDSERSRRRPSGFATKAGGDCVIMTFKRVKE
jgi:hypothetical protein